MMSGEADCTASGGSSFILEPPLSSIISNNNSKTNKVNNNNNENTDCDLEKAVCASTNINNNSNSVNNLNNNNLTKNNNSNVANSIVHAAASTATKFLNDVTSIDGKILLKCERCDNFETISPALLAVHTVQCRAEAVNASGSSSRKISLGNLGHDSGTETDTIAAASSSSSSSNNHLANDSSGNSSGTNKNSPDIVGTVGSVSGQQQLQQHHHQQQQQQHQRKLFECDVCNMKFSNGANMRRHKMRHTGVKPYECRVCQKRFFRKDHLAEHFTTHTKTLPYHCPICNRGFQRQIAMRAHFQNEHVGQHDLVKTCPLCSYRAGTMKSLRIHFFNRHGIDLDNPGPNAPSSLLLALDPTNSANYLPSIALAAAAAAASAANSSNMGASGNSNSGPTYSDSGDSLRSADNGTPPMHFLTPHVEISMADNDTFKSEPMTTSVSSAIEIQPCSLATNSSHPPNGDSPSPHSADSNSNAPSSSQSLIGSVLQGARNQLILEGQITPSISLIPIKQEPSSEDYDSSLSKSMRQQNMDQQSGSMQNMNAITTNAAESTASSSTNLTSLIKVSPLKSLLREDLKRRISARATNRATRNSGGGGSHANTSSSTSASMANNNNNNATSISNTSSNLLNHHHLLSNSSITITTESTTTTSVSPSNSTLASIATTSNGAITSTGPETELHLRGTILDNERGKRMLQCLFCGIEFPDQTLYFLHKGCHSESNPWKCNICGEQCNNVYEFNSHLLSKSHQ